MLDKLRKEHQPMTNERTNERLEEVSSHSLDITEQNIEKLKELFPEVLTEKKIDFDKLRLILGDEVETAPERYNFTWNGKKQAMKLAQQPTTTTLKPNKEKSKNWDETQNLYIEGDNLEVLKLLQKSFSKKVSAIYVDPPYNTGRDIIYPNDYSLNIDEYLKVTGQIANDGVHLQTNTESNGRYHTDWLDMMYPRLKLAKNLLAANGIIVITIDDFELPRLMLIMDEIFGETNRLGTVTIKNNPSGRSTSKGFAISNEYALFYGNSDDTAINRLPRNDKQQSRYGETDEIGKFEWVNFRKHGGYKEDAPTMYYPIYLKNDASGFRIPNMNWIDIEKRYEILDEPLNDEFVSYPIDDEGRDRRWKWGLDRALESRNDMAVRLDRNKVPAVYIKARMKDEGMLPLTIWDEKKYSATEYGTNYLKKLFNGRTFDYPKSVYAVEDALRVATADKNALILDFFSGSSTTADAVFRLNAEDQGTRKFIMIQIPEKVNDNSDAFASGFHTIPEIAEERIRRAGDKIVSDNPLLADKLDIGFKVFELSKSNIKKWNVNPEDLVGQLSLIANNFEEGSKSIDVVYEIMLKQGLDLTYPINEIKVGDAVVYDIAFGAMFVVLGDKITSEVAGHIMKQIADEEAENSVVVLQDEKFINDSEKLNTIEQLNASGIQYNDILSI